MNRVVKGRMMRNEYEPDHSDKRCAESINKLRFNFFVSA